jgi:hypothetical protein
VTRRECDNAKRLLDQGREESSEERGGGRASLVEEIRQMSISRNMRGAFTYCVDAGCLSLPRGREVSLEEQAAVVG